MAQGRVKRKEYLQYLLSVRKAERHNRPRVFFLWFSDKETSGMKILCVAYNKRKKFPL